MVLISDHNNKPRKVVCYYSSWTATADGDRKVRFCSNLGLKTVANNFLSKFAPEDINAEVCTHVNIAFASMKNNRLEFNDNGKDSENYE